MKSTTNILIDASRHRLGDFVELTKPRMNFLVLITTMVGFYLVSDRVDLMLLLHALFGTALSASCAAALNQFVEREHDKLMPRTRNRPLPAGRVAPIEALALGIALGIVGVGYLAILVNPLTAALSLFTILTYVLIYTPLKRVTTLNTVVGAVPGAVPAMMGCTAVQGHLSLEGLALFAILFFWQMPHFLAIAILYRRDYKDGGFKMLPVVDPTLDVSARQIVLYTTALIPISLMPVMLNMAAAVYFVAAVLLGLAFLSFGISLATTKARIDARKLFFASIIYLPLLLGFMMIGCDEPSATAARPAPTFGEATVRGRITYHGPTIAQPVIRNHSCHPDAEPIVEETVVVSDKGELANVFVYIVDAPASDGSSREPALLDQIDCRYAPHVVGVQVGQALRVRSSDPTFHNVHYTPSVNRAANFGLTTAGSERTVHFQAHEFIRVKCDVHPWMTAWIGVFDSPFFAMTDQSGAFEIPSLPPGQYTIAAWHERFGKLERQITVSGSEVLEIEFSYEAP